MGNEMRVESGTLLAAWPDLMDPNFMHSVVLICQHTVDGAYGLVTNRATELALRDLLPEHPVLADSDFPVHGGGPVEPRALQFLHIAPDDIPGGVSLDGSLWLGGDLAALANYVEQDGEQARRTVRVFLGYSGWGAGQLEVELDSGSWIPAPPSTEAIFGPAGEPTWRRVVRSIGDAGNVLESQPPDVSWN